MKIYWSASARGFFSNAAHSEDQIPDDAVKITEKMHAQLLAANAEGASIENGPSGKPVAVWPAKAPVEERRERAIVRVKREAARRIDAIFPLWDQLNAMRACVEHGILFAEDDRFAALDAIRQASDLIEQDIAASADPDAVPVADHPLWPSANKDA